MPFCFSSPSSDSRETSDDRRHDVSLENVSHDSRRESGGHRTQRRQRHRRGEGTGQRRDKLECFNTLAGPQFF